MKKYGKDYRRAADGYEYIGSWYKTSLTGDALKKEARFFWICLAVMSVQFVLGLSLNNAGSRILWILLPFVALFLPLLYGWMGSAKLYGIGKRLENARANQAASDALAGTDSKGTSEPSAPLGIRAVVPSSAAQLCGRGSAVQRCFSRGYSCAGQ